MSALLDVLEGDESEDAELVPVAVRAVFIDPVGVDKVTVRFVHVPAQPAHPAQGGHGLQLVPSAVEALLGSKVVELHRLPAEWLMTAADAQGVAWWLGHSGPHRGRGLVIRWNRVGDNVSDAEVTLQEVGILLALDEEEGNHEHAEAA